MSQKSKRRFKELINDLGDRHISLQNIVLGEKSIGMQDFYQQNEVSYKEAVVLAQYAKAIVNQDTKAAEFLRDTAGEKPSTDLNIQDARSPLQDLSTEELRLLAEHYRQLAEAEKDGD